MVSVHDPDEYLANVKDERQAQQRYLDLLKAYLALGDLKKQGEVKTIGSKDWKTIERISNDVALDWVMIENSMIIKNHFQDLVDFILRLEKRRNPAMLSH